MGGITNRDPKAEQANEALVDQHKQQIAARETKPGMHRGHSPRDPDKDNRPAAAPSLGIPHPGNTEPGREWIAEERERQAQVEDHELVGQSRRLQTHKETQRTTYGN